ncbi:MAG: DUF1549 and DUF1553 domain-containing protein [Planctomycetes bacterium]|nr:DUF1549 and DUF1553 domain-containing protein [Planctomycetota bacterium]
MTFLSVVPRCLPALAVVFALTAVARSETRDKTPTPPLPLDTIAAQLERITVEPAAIELAGPMSYCQLLVSGQLKTGETVDLSRSVQYDQPQGLVEVSSLGMIRAKQDGQGKLSIAFRGQKVEVPLVVRGTKDAFHPSYVRDVNPVLGKLGCNAGTCHGSKNGKNGFKLSLRGYDPQYDHRALTDDVFARRFNRAAPEQSLMLLKPTGVVPHVGGALMQPGEPYYEILRQWIADGAQLDLSSTRVAKIEIFPQGITIPLPQMSQQMRVLATYADGTKRDVTAESFIDPSDIEILATDKHGLVTALRRGEGAILARFEGAYAAAPIYVMGDRTGYAWNDAPAFNYIDELVYAKQKRVKVTPSEVCSDAEFLRRVYLDLTGLPPTIEELRSFVADQRDARVKRDELVDKLIGSPAFVEHWTNKWADMLQVNAKFLGAEGAGALRTWIRQAVEANKPYNEFVYEVLTAKGANLDNPPASYFKRLRAPDEVMENTTQLFLSVRFNCNKCHDHPFERWTQDQYYHLSAYFAQIERKEDPRSKGKKLGGTDVDKPLPALEIISDIDKGEVTHERTGAMAPPQFPYDYPGMSQPSGSRREQLARWLTAKENPYFAKSYVNRIWSYLLGVGLIEPVDDIRAGNPATNPELLDKLTREFIDSRFDVRKLMATICKSRTYQLSVATSRWNDGDTQNYSHALARRLSAEVLYDAVHKVTGSTSHLPGLPVGSRATAMIDPTQKLPDAFMDLFGRPARESACECERGGGVMLGPVMNLIMGPTINDAISDPKNEITKLLATEPDDKKVVEALFMSILSRPPTAQETANGVKLLNSPLKIDQLETARKELTEYERQLNERQAAWEKSVQSTTWQTIKPAAVHSKAGAKLEVLPDHSILVSDKLDKDEYVVVIETEAKGVTGFRIEALTDKKLPGQGPGRAKNGNFVLSELKILDSTGNPIELANPQADFAQEGFPPANVLDGNQETGWAIQPQTGKNHALIVETKQDLGGEGNLNLAVRLSQQHVDKKHALGRFRVSLTTAPRPLVQDNLPPKLAEALAIEPAKRTAEQQQGLTDYFRRDEKRLSQLRSQVAQLEQAAANPRLVAAQDLAWALINSPAFIFNR